MSVKFKDEVMFVGISKVIVVSPAAPAYGGAGCAAAESGNLVPYDLSGHRVFGPKSACPAEP